MGPVDRIFELVDQKYKEQRDFAKDLGVTASIVSQWRTGKSASYNRYLPQIAAVLNTSVEYLLTGSAPAADTSSPASPALQRLSNALDQLNEEGQEKLLDYAADLVASGRYIKSRAAGLGQEA